MKLLYSDEVGNERVYYTLIKLLHYYVLLSVVISYLLLNCE